MNEKDKQSFKSPTRIPTRWRALLIGIVSLAFAVTALIGASPAKAEKADDEIVICAIDSTSGDFSIMSTPKHFAYQMAAEEITTIRPQPFFLR